MDMDIKMKFNSFEKECCFLLQAAETSVCSFKCAQRIAQSPAQPWNDWGKTKGNLPAGPEEVARLDNYRPLKTESAYSGTGHWTRTSGCHPHYLHCFRQSCVQGMADRPFKTQQGTLTTAACFIRSYLFMARF